MYIAVSGNLGSGKTTVARGLANAFNCLVYPRRPYDASYIEDLFREPERWTAEAQICFMVHKHDGIREGLDRGRLFMLDRTFSEDVNVFAEGFHEEGSIDERSMELIRQLSADLEARIERPRVIVFCECPVSICEARLRERPRSYQRFYPPGHLERLDRRLRAWRADQRDIPIVTINTDKIDYREPRAVLNLARTIDQMARQPQADQLDLFGSAAPVLRQDAELGGPRLIGPSLLRPRLIYLAAPFTNRAALRDLSKNTPIGLFSGEEYIENIPASYRRQLSALARAIESHGHRVLLPHRDINRWGSRALPASEIARRCLAAVDECDGFIGLLGESFGGHAEIGYALGRNKPALILASGSVPTTFFAKGVSTLQSVALVEARSMAQLIRELRRVDPWLAMIQKGGGL